MSDLRLLLHAYRDGDLDLAGARQLVAALAEQPALVAEWQLEAEISVALDPAPQGLSRMVVERLSQGSSRHQAGREFGRRAQARPAQPRPGRSRSAPSRRSRPQRLQLVLPAVLIAAALVVGGALALFDQRAALVHDPVDTAPPARVSLATVVHGCGVPAGTAVYAEDAFVGCRQRGQA